ncbi:Ca-activated chloride channel family protein [Lachnospiraceae bacterium NE2001]|nr:Ca-activated chloride channel family protein [Lachnospiraceae bacterium NE2001]
MRKITFKRTISMIIAAGLMTSAFTGCGGSYEATDSSSREESTVAYTTSDEASDSATESSKSKRESGAVYETTEAAAEDWDNSMTQDAWYEEEDEDYGYDSREYAHVSENDFIATSVESTSTFSADVDTASYSNIRNYLNNGNTVPEDAVRIEEMINYFHYDYDEPAKGEPFSVNMEVDTCPWNEDHQLVMIGLKAKAIDTSKRKPTHFVFLIDTSGSMDEPNKLPLVKTAYIKLLNELDENDTVSIVTYAGSDKVVLEGECGANTDKIAEAIENLQAYGSTNGSAGINTAYDLAEEYFIKGGNNRVILATDGDLNVGVTSEDGLTELITEKKESGIFLSVLGFGNDNLKDNKLEALADNGNGNYAFIDSVYEAKRVLVEEMGSTLETVAKDVKLQTTFDENVVEKYRLIGYENRMMANEDFDDDSVDGGEIGSGHEVTALYEIIPTKNADSFDNHILDLSIRYKAPQADESKLLQYSCKSTGKSFDNNASDNMLWVESVAALGMFLKDSEYSGESSVALARNLAEKTSYRDDALRVEYMSLLDKVEDNYGTAYSDYDDDYDDDYDYYDYDDSESDVNEIEAN